MPKIKTAVFLVVMAVLVIPAIQSRYAIIHEPPLKGYSVRPAAPELKYFTWERWFSQDFQQVFTTGLDDNAGFRNTLVRTNNQVD